MTNMISSNMKNLIFGENCKIGEKEFIFFKFENFSFVNYSSIHFKNCIITKEFNPDCNLSPGYKQELIIFNIFDGSFEIWPKKEYLYEEYIALGVKFDKVSVLEYHPFMIYSEKLKRKESK